MDRDTAAASSGDPDVLSAYLRQSGEPFLLLEGSGDARARLRFSGWFEGRGVVWDCEIVALRPGARCFIDVGAPGPSGVPLRVGLSLAHIDRPAMLKTIVMIRNYRRLRRGRHEFGRS